MSGDVVYQPAATANPAPPEPTKIDCRLANHSALRALRLRNRLSGSLRATTVAGLSLVRMRKTFAP